MKIFLIGTSIEQKYAKVTHCHHCRTSFTSVPLSFTSILFSFFRYALFLLQLSLVVHGVDEIVVQVVAVPGQEGAETVLEIETCQTYVRTAR